MTSLIFLVWLFNTQVEPLCLLYYCPGSQLSKLKVLWHSVKVLDQIMSERSRLHDLSVSFCYNGYAKAV